MGYFLFHAISGERGLLALIRLSQQIESARLELDITHANRLRLERNITLMRDDSIDLDLLDEQARRLLGYADKNEQIFTLE